MSKNTGRENSGSVKKTVNPSALAAGLKSPNLDESVMSARQVARLDTLPVDFLDTPGKIVHSQARALLYEKFGKTFQMKAYPLLEKALIEGSWEEREAAFRGLTMIGEKAGPPLKAFVQNSLRDAALQDAIYFAIRAMAAILGGKAAPILKSWAKGKDITVACYGIEAMADTGDGSCGKYLIELLGNRSNIIRDVAFRTIERIGTHLIPVLKEGLTSPDPSVRAACFILLGKVMSSKAIPAMKSFMESDNPELRLLVVKALQGIDTEGASKYLVDYLSDQSYLVRDGAVRALTARGQKSIPILRVAISKGSIEKRRLAMKILVSIGSLEALLPIHGLLAKGTIEERLTAAEALRGAKDSFTLNALAEVLATARGGTAMSIFDNLAAMGPGAAERVLEFALEHPCGAGLFPWVGALADLHLLPDMIEGGCNPAALSAREISLRLFLAARNGDSKGSAPLLVECSGRQAESRAEISAALSRAITFFDESLDPVMKSEFRKAGIDFMGMAGEERGNGEEWSNGKGGNDRKVIRESPPPARESILPEEPLTPSISYTKTMTFSNIVKQILDNEGEEGIAKLITDLENSMTPRDIAPILKVYFDMDPAGKGADIIAGIIEKSGVAEKVASILMDCFEEESFYSATLVALARTNPKVRKSFFDCIDSMIEAEGSPRERLMKLIRGKGFDTIEYLAAVSGKFRNQEIVSLLASEICSEGKHPRRKELLSIFADKLTDYDFREASSARRFFSCLGQDGAIYLLEKCEEEKSRTFNALVLEFIEENRKLFPFLKEWVSSFKPMGDEARDLKNGIIKCLASLNAL